MTCSHCTKPHDECECWDDGSLGRDEEYTNAVDDKEDTGMTYTDLAAKMLARADADGLPDNHDMRIKAKAFDEAVREFYGNPQETYDVKKFVGCWARARRSWCDYTGEPLV